MSVIDPKPIIHGRDHMTKGVDPIPGLPSLGVDVEDIIQALPGLDAFWKLDETDGDVAHDSSGNGYHLTQAGGLSPPTWAQEEAPPGHLAPLFEGPAGPPAGDGTDGFNDFVSAAQSAFTNNFTAGIWVSYFDNIQNNELIGQGNGAHSAAGWTLAVVSGKLWVIVGDPTPDDIRGDNTLTPGDWYFMACVRDSGTFKMYVNGLLQAETMTTSFTGSPDTWLANDNFTPGGIHNQLTDGLLSYGFIVDDVLSGTQLLEIYEAGFNSGAVGAGKVWTSNGDGSASWQYPTIEVEY